jgi:hypothetical protein
MDYKLSLEVKLTSRVSLVVFFWPRLKIGHLLEPARSVLTVLTVVLLLVGHAWVDTHV